MILGLLKKKNRNLLALMLASTLMFTSAVPVSASTSDSSETNSITTVTETVYGKAFGPAVSAAPLSWNLLSKLNRGLMSFTYAAEDRPISKLSSNERYFAFLTYVVSDEVAAGRKIVQIQDRQTGELLSVKTPDATGWVHDFDMSPDARFVAYSYGKGLLSPEVKVYLFDRSSDTLETVNGVGSTKGFPDLSSNKVSISADGRFVIFDTEADGVVSGDDNGKQDVYLYDREASGIKLQRISVPLEANSNDESRDPSISADGSKIAFVSKSKLTAEDDYIGTESLYLYDREVNGGPALKRITQGYTPSLSGDGRFMAFTTYKDDLGVDDTNYSKDIYVYDDDNGSFQRVSFKPGGTEFDRDSMNPSISRNGAYVAYETDLNDDDENVEVYVADRQGLFSAKVSVPGAPLSLVPSSKRPAVSDTGTVNFFSNYVEKIGEMEFTVPDYFIATNGTTPAWPPGSTLQASDMGADQITLSWSGISDPDGVTGYALYKNGIPIHYTPATGQVNYSVNLTNQVREQGMSYLFQVEAIDSKYHWSMNGPTYNWESAEGPVETPMFLIWRGEREDANGPLKQESNITIRANGVKGLETKVEWNYKEETSGAVTTKTDSVALTESPPNSGFYTGTFQMSPIATELTSIKMKQKKADGTEVVKEAAELPVPVGGGLQISFVNASPEELRGAILTVLGISGERTLVLADNGVITLSGLPPDDQYEIYLYTPDHQYEMGSLESITIQPGKTNTVTIPVKVPSQVRVKVVNVEGQPVANVPVTLWDSEHNLLMNTTTMANGLTYSRGGLLRDQIVTAELDLSDLFYEVAPGTNLSLKLDGGDNMLTVNLISPGKGTLELTVKDPSNKPVFNAYVTATQTYKGKPVITQARTSLDGKIRMELFAGDAVLEASEFSNLYRSGQVPVMITANMTTNLDIPVMQPGQGVVNLRVFKKALDTEWQGPLNMENEMFVSYVETNHGWAHTYFENAVSIGGSPGTPVYVCVSGDIYANVSQCKNIALDDNSNATAEIRLEETGARVQGKVEIGRDISYTATVYELKDNGSKVWVSNAWDNRFQSDPFNINVPRGGKYRMEIIRSERDANSHYRYEYATVDFSIAENQIKNLGEIQFSPSSYFINQTGNYFTAQPSLAMPGSTLSLRASYRNNNDRLATNALLLLDIPEGMTPVTDELGNQAVTGAKGPVSVEGNTLRVPLGNLAKGDGGTVVYKLAVSPAFNHSAVVVTARIKAVLGPDNMEETLGTAYLDTPMITLEAQERVSSADRGTVLSGFAPAGAILTLYDSNIRIGGAVANASGVWKASVTLADLGNPGFHALWAEATVNAVNLKSDKVYVNYDTDGPQLLRMAMAQAPAGRWVTMETGKNAPDIAYTVLPGNPFLLDFEFSNPDQVENVRVYMDGQEGDPIAAVRDGNLFHATVPTTHDALGGIYIDYDVKKPAYTYDGAIPDLEQFRASLPPMMRDFEVVSTTPFELVNGIYSGTVKLRFPQFGNMKMSITLTLDPESNYRPTEAEKVLAARSGVPAIQTGFETDETDTSFSIKTHGYMPRNLLPEGVFGFTGFSTKELPIPLPDQVAHWEHTAEYFIEIKTEVDGVKEQIPDIKGQYEQYMGFAEKVNKIMYKVDASGLDCLAELPGTLKQAGKALGALVGGEIAKTGLAAWTSAMTLSGAGGVAAGLTTSLIGARIDKYVNEQIDAIGTGYNQCNDGTDNNKKKKGRKIASPKWIYDPSGYVYEAVKSNPLEDVTATVMYRDKDSGLWKVWKAEEYDQINPQLTDEAGKYGWDVPPGKWKVVWSKEGYEPVSSDELDVPPPRTEVNAGLISRASPKISTVTGVVYGSGSYVDITFSKYLKVVELKDGAVTLTDSRGIGMEGTAAFIHKEESAADKTAILSRTIRFTPKDLMAGDIYQLKLDRAYITSYSGVKITDEDAAPVSFTAKALDTTGPAVDTVKVESGGRIVRITYNEPIAATANPSKFRLNGADGLINSAVADKKRGQTETRDLLLTVDGAVTEASELMLMEGAVKDLQGNPSTEANKTLSLANSPNLSGLTVDHRTLSPVFDPLVTAYSLKLPAGTKQLAMTATASDSSAALLINGLPAESGLVQTVTIPDDDHLSVTVVLNGMAVRTYMIKVTYESGNDGPSSTPQETPASPIKDPLTLGEKAKVEKKPSSSGGTAIYLTIGKEAINEALIEGTQSQVLDIEVKEPADEVILQFPAESLGQMADAHATIRLMSGMMSVNLDPAALSIGKPADGAMVRLSINLTKGQLGRDAEEAARKLNMNWQSLTRTASVTFEIVGGTQAVEVSFAKKSAIEGSFLKLQGESLEVYRYNPEAAAWFYVRTIPSETDHGLQFDMSTGDIYMVTTFTNRFKDTNGHWAMKDIDWMARRLLVHGVSPTEFRPEGSVTRAEFIAMLVRALGIQTNGASASSMTFSDLSQDAWYYNEVLAAAANGLVNGFESGQFVPDENITREQMAVMISRAYERANAGRNAPSANLDKKFRDSARIHSWAMDAVAQVLNEGMMQGITDDTFLPEGITTRAQAAVVIGRFLRKQE
ncbi:S-layer homology domain-containing protein [Paenibacillus sedimenti]|uniref:S-layer homology domain-containing protein n=1 Tax=Paenibacillus sedimenti TaxID=2770274 RepID=A0A926KWW4_9BACL|nr:S-layer homology domain-containing protein [Paenibacillus sedimenti]MBD0384798.1 S-layer homology domain-containing protein [Paenibacillus sedimenti]